MHANIGPFQVETTEWRPCRLLRDLPFCLILRNRVGVAVSRLAISAAARRAHRDSVAGLDDELLFRIDPQNVPPQLALGALFAAGLNKAHEQRGGSESWSATTTEVAASTAQSLATRRSSPGRP